MLLDVEVLVDSLLTVVHVVVISVLIEVVGMLVSVPPLVLMPVIDVVSVSVVSVYV